MLSYSDAIKATPLPVIIGDVRLPPALSFKIVRFNSLRFQSIEDIDTGKIYAAVRQLLLDKFYEKTEGTGDNQ